MGILTKIRGKAKNYIHRKLIFRLRIFALIFVVICSIVVYKIFAGEISLYIAILGLLIGTGFGLIFGRINKINWHPETEKIITRIDKTAIILLIIYLIIEIGRKWIFSHWFHGATLNAFVLIFLAGLFLGRLLTMVKNIRKILKKKGN